jgi:hypothetical protein
MSSLARNPTARASSPHRRSRFLNAAVALGFATQAAFALAQTYITQPAWNFAQETVTGYGTFVNGPGTPPSGSTGSVQLTVFAPGGELFYTQQFAGTLLSQVTGLAYNTYVVSSAIPETANLQFDFDPGLSPPTTGYQGRAVFSPSLIKPTNPVQVGAWQTWNPMTARAWWGSGSSPRVLAALCTQSAPCTWAEILTAFPNAKVLAAPSAFGFKLGNSNSAAQVSIDSFSMGTTGTSGPVVQYIFALAPPVQCAAGTYSGSGFAPCTNASPGSYVPLPGATSATPASAGYFVDTAAATAQLPCVPGRYASSPGSSSCTLAGQGFFAAGSAAIAQTACPLGRYADVTGLAACIPAAIGFYVDTISASTQTACASGFTTATIGSTSVAACTALPSPCPAGSFSGTGNAPCTLAALGRFVPTTGATSELPCPPGSFSSTTGAVSCTPAAAGSFVPTSGASTQQLCGAGSFAAVQGLTVCALAAANFYVPLAGAVSQIPCPLGSSSGAGAVACTGLPILNIDDSDPPTKYDAGTDGTLLMRYLLGLRGAALTDGALGNNARRNATLIADHISTYRTLFDVDGDGATNALTDGVMIVRRLLGLNGAALTAGAKNTTRSDVDVAAAIDALRP